MNIISGWGRVPEGSLNSEYQGIFSIQTGVANAAGHEPRERDEILELPICKIDLRGFPMKIAKLTPIYRNFERSIFNCPGVNFPFMCVSTERKKSEFEIFIYYLDCTIISTHRAGLGIRG